MHGHPTFTISVFKGPAYLRGQYTLFDVSKDKTWADVKAFQDHRDFEGKLLSTVNHRDKDFEQVKSELQKLAEAQ